MAALAVARACWTAAMDGCAADAFTKDFGNALESRAEIAEVAVAGAYEVVNGHQYGDRTWWNSITRLCLKPDGSCTLVHRFDAQSDSDANAIRWCNLVFVPGYEAEDEHATLLIWQRRLDVCKGTYSVKTVANSREQECPLVKLVFCIWPHHLQHNSEQRQSTLQ